MISFSRPENSCSFTISSSRTIPNDVSNARRRELPGLVRECVQKRAPFARNVRWRRRCPSSRLKAGRYSADPASSRRGRLPLACKRSRRPPALLRESGYGIFTAQALEPAFAPHSVERRLIEIFAPQAVSVPASGRSFGFEFGGLREFASCCIRILGQKQGGRCGDDLNTGSGLWRTSP